MDSDGQLSFFVDLDGFEGPLDLLLSLAKEQKVDLLEISIFELAFTLSIMAALALNFSDLTNK